MQVMKTITCVAAIVLMLGGCTKYENGPDFSVLSKKERLSNNWTVNEAIHLSGDGGSFQNYYEGYQFNIGQDEKYTLFFRPNGIGYYTEGGTWKLSEDKLSFTTTCSTGGGITYHILRLAHNELWVRFTDDGNEWELHLFPKQVN
jgi:hypothetical protein